MKFDVANGSPDTESFDFFFKFVIVINILLLFHVLLLNTTTVRYLVRPDPTQSLTGSLTATGLSQQVHSVHLFPSVTMRSVREANLLTGLFQKMNIIMLIFIIIKLTNIMMIYFINSDVFYLMPL